MKRYISLIVLILALAYALALALPANAAGLPPAGLPNTPGLPFRTACIGTNLHPQYGCPYHYPHHNSIRRGR
jgi:hypothetical protein